jgi:DNA-binding protein HU-beta
MKVNKTQLIDSVAEVTGLSKSDSQRAIDATIEVITKALIEGDQVALLGFGQFGVKARAGRMGRDPRTGNPLEIPPTKVAGFKPGKALKDAVNGRA